MTTISLTTIIGGAGVAGEGRDMEIRNPADPRELVAAGRASSPEQAATALAEAVAAREAWS
ncbi:MAG TPA: aldehyde dehydrogenase, partial [Actinomycetes bacterium]|nr:aldehyde dehydrogenase [Actinomycetes bacterium]